MSKLKIAFYKAEYGGWDDKFINRFSGNKGYSHCEVMVDSTTMIGAHFYTRSVQEFKYRDVVSSPRWDVYEYDVDAEEAIEFARTFIGTKYDTKGVVLYFIGLDLGASKTGVWCSELCQLVLNRAFGVHENTLIMPNDMIVDERLGTLVTNGLQGREKILEELVADDEVDKYGRIIDTFEKRNIK